MGEEAEPGPSADRECLDSRRGTSDGRTIASPSLEGPSLPSRLLLPAVFASF